MKTASQFSKIENVKIFGDLVKNIKFAMITTINKEGRLRSCPLTAQEIDIDGDLWFVINKNSEVYKNVHDDSRVNVSFSSESQIYISVSGKGETIDDSDKLNMLWSPSLKIWFPIGKGDPNIAILKINVESVEYWQHPTFKVVHLGTFAKAFIGGEKEVPGEHKRLDFR
ncbi:MAG: pyridoxamine 5'-phosphate oxidase family protein [Pseudobdellovibrionaceae bacterium]